MEVILNGVISGLVLALLIGPVFFTIIQTSIERGFGSGVLVAVGVSLSDALYISLTYLGVYRLFDHGNFRVYLAYFGGAVLLTFGVYYLFIKSKRGRFDVRAAKPGSPWRLIGKGFIINGLTPTVLMFWLGAVGLATTKFGYSTPPKAIPYFASIVCTVFATDILKAKLADKLRLILTPRFVRSLNIILGFVLLVFGCRLIYYAGAG